MRSVHRRAPELRELVAELPADRGRPSCAVHFNPSADDHEHGTLPRQERENVGASSTQSPADPDLVLALGRRVAEESEDPKRGEEQGKPGERSDCNA